MKVDKYISKTWFFYGFSFIVLCLIYQRVLFAVVEDPDAFQILKTLAEVRGPIDYLTKLWNYELLDFQPVRDLTLYVDVFFTNVLGHKTYTFQNLLWWLGCGYGIEKILKNLFTERSSKDLRLGVFLFLIYPLFSNVIPWGMARKHVLSFFFITWATARVTDPRLALDIKESAKISFLYALGVLSQPINLLFPVWCMGYLYLQKNLRLKQVVLLGFPMMVIFISVTRLNYYYYETSKVFKFYYPPKTDAGFDPADRILALGHYFFDLFFPYQFSFYPDLGTFTVIIGIAICTSFFYLALKKIGLKQTLIWGSFISFPLAIVLTSPGMMFVYYLLTPALGCFLILFGMLKQRNLPVIAVALLAIFWVLFSVSEVKHWKSSQAIAAVSFRRQPNCLSAYVSIRMDYDIELKANPEARKFLEQHECLLGHGKTTYDRLTEIGFHSNVLYYEDDVPLDQRLKALGAYGRLNFYPQLLKATLEIKNERFTEADQTLKEFEYYLRNEQKTEKIERYHSGIARYLYPYCLKHGYKKCLDYSSQYANERFKSQTQ